MTRWWWVRHGPTHEKAFTGWRDVPADLSDLEQIARLNAYLPEGAILVSSDLSRAISTADCLAEHRERLPHAPELREFNFGVWDGMTFADVAARDPELSREFWENPGTVMPPEGESWQAVAARVAPFVNDINQRFQGRDIIAVAHIGLILTQVALAKRISAGEALGQHIDNLSVTRICHGQDAGIGPVNHVP
ncbi:MAG: histidine phosphatase family protein [Paracoccaceae bacterium]